MHAEATWRAARTALFLCVAAASLAACRADRERWATAQDLDGGAGHTGASTADPAAMHDVKLRRLWAGRDFNFYVSSPSPDGRYVSEVDWSTGDLAVRDLVTGELHRLTDKGPWEESADYAEVSRFSPDGRRIIYGWFNSSAAASGSPSEHYEVRVQDFSVDESGTPRPTQARVVYGPAAMIPYWFYGWTSDDEVLTGIYRPDNTTALGLLSLADGSLRVLKSFDWREARAVLSTDGKWVAYDFPPDPQTGDRDIYLLPVDGGSELKLVGDQGNDEVLGWMPGDGSLLFQSDRSGSPSVWRLPVSDGRPVGPPVLLRSDIRNLEPLGFAGESLYYGVIVESPTFRTARIDSEEKRLVILPTVFEPPSRGWIRGLEWSPDGQHVIHAVRPGDTPSRPTRIYLRTADGRVVREWTFDVTIRRGIMRWAPDKEWVLLSAIDGHGRDGIFRIDLSSGELSLVRRFGENETDRSFQISPDGRSLYFARIRTVDGELVQGEADIVEYDLETGRERAIQPVRDRGSVLPSPDGAWLAYTEAGAPGRDPTIQLFPADGGRPRILHRGATGKDLRLVGWTPDGQWLLFYTGPSATAYELWRLSPTGGDAERIAGELPGTDVPGLALHPDGRTIAYRTGELRGEIWALDFSGKPDSVRNEP